MSHDFTLYHYWRSSCSWRLRWAFAIKGLPYKSEPVNLLKGEQKTEAYLARNPNASVPALTVDGETFGESLALMEWLEERYPEPSLLPSDPRGRLIVRQMAHTIASGTQPIQNLAVMTYLTADTEERGLWARHWITRGLTIYETLLRQHAGTYSFGGSLTFADLCLVPQMYNAQRFAVDMSQFPIAERIYRHCLTLPSCQKAHPDQQPGAR